MSSNSLTVRCLLTCLKEALDAAEDLSASSVQFILKISES